MVDIFLGLADLPVLSHILARIFGTVLIVLSLGALLNQKFFLQICFELHRQYSAVLLTAVLILLATTGALIVHNAWSFDLVGVITLFLWVVLLASASCIIFPKKLIHFVQHAAQNQRHFVIIMSVVCVIGFSLLFFSFDTAIAGLFREPQLDF